MSRRSIHGHSRRRKNRRKKEEACTCPHSSPMHYVDESGQPLQASGTGNNLIAGATGPAALTAYSAGKAISMGGPKAFGGLFGNTFMGAGAGYLGAAAVGTVVGGTAQAIAEKVRRSKEAKIFEGAYTDEGVGAMDLTA